MSAAELFKVTCVTCQARLSVRNEELIGQIVACPRCESMVQIAPPAPAKPTPVVAAAVVPPLEAPPEVPVETPALEEPVVESTSPAIATAEAGLAGGGASMWVLSLGSFLVGAVITGGVLWLRSPGTMNEVAAAPGNAEQTEIVEDSDSTPIAPTPDVPAGEQLTADPITPTRVEESTAGEEEESNPFTPAAVDAPTKEPTPTEAADPAPLQETSEESEETKLVVETPEPVRIARKFDPLRFDPEQLDLSAVTRGPEELEMQPGTTPRPQPVPHDEDILEAAGGIPSIRVSANSVDRELDFAAAERLSRSVPGLQIEQMPLARFFTLISQLSGAPVSCDPLELQMAGITSSKSISCDARGLTIEAVLAEVLDPLRLEAQPQDRQIVIVRKAGDKIRENSYPVDDLLGGTITRESFANWIPLLVAPETWEEAGGSGTIEVQGGKLLIRQTQRVHYQVLFFLERIRQAKGVPLVSRYPEKLLSKTPESVAFRQRMVVPSTFTFSLDTPLEEVFRHWEMELGLPIAVDWPRLEQVNLWPSTPVVAAVAGRPWKEALRVTLSPLGLDWRAHAGMLEITTREVVEHDFVLDLYPAEGNEAEDLRNRASQLSPDVVTVADSANGLVYVLAPGKVHRQLAQ